MSVDLVRPSTLHASLTAVIGRLKGRAEVDGVLLLGTTGTERLTPASDYDLLVVLQEPAHGFRVEVTIIDGRTADIVIVPRSCLARISEDTHGLTDDEWAVARWLTAGRLVIDRELLLVRTIDAARKRLASAPLSADRVADVAQHINYDLRVNRAYAQSEDKVYLLALRLRLLHSFFRVFMGWFEVRGLAWTGEKQAVRDLCEQDPEFLALVEKWLAEPDVRTAVQLERQAAQRALAPAGGLWPDDMVARYGGTWERLMS